MTDRVYSASDSQPSLAFLLIDALTLIVRNRLVFLIAALPIAMFAAALAYVLDADQQFIDYRSHWGWEFLFALIYAMFLDRWIKETLLDEASPSEDVDQLRRALIAPGFLAFAVLFFMLAMALDWLPLESGVPVVDWLPHLVLWSTTVAFLALLLPAMSAAEPLTLSQAWALARPVRPLLYKLIAGAALLSLAAYAATRWGLDILPKKPWAPAAMDAAHRFVDCLLLAFVGFGLASVFRQITGWAPPEPEDHPYRGMGKRRRRA